MWLYQEKINDEINGLHIWNILRMAPPLDVEVARWDVFEVIFYGDIVHVNKDKRPIFESWRDNQMLFPFLMNMVQWTLFHILKLIEYIGSLIKEELGETP